jgi:2-oxoglutarate ferredoxin oxidoreductase subunit alpha
MEDEIASMGAIIGASVAGLKAMTATSGPGFSLMQENIGYASMAEIPCVIVNVMRGGPSTGLPTKTSQSDVMQARWGSHGDHPVIALAPSGLLECFNITVRAFNLSEKYRVPAIVLLDEVVAHAHENVILPSAGEVPIINRIKPTMPPEWYVPYDETATGIPPMAAFGDGYRYNITGLTHDRMGFPTSRPDETDALLRRLMRKIKNNLADIVSVEEVSLDDAEIVLVAFGSVARVARAAVREARSLGIKAGLLRLISIWPFPKFHVERLPENLRAIIVPEMNFGQIVGEVLKYYRGKARVYPYNRVDSELMTVEEILKQIREV